MKTIQTSQTPINQIRAIINDLIISDSPTRDGYVLHYNAIDIEVLGKIAALWIDVDNRDLDFFYNDEDFYIGDFICVLNEKENAAENLANTIRIKILKFYEDRTRDMINRCLEDINGERCYSTDAPAYRGDEPGYSSNNHIWGNVA